MTGRRGDEELEIELLDAEGEPIRTPDPPRLIWVAVGVGLGVLGFMLLIAPVGR